MVCTREVKQRVRDLEGREYPCPRLFCRPGGADWELILKSERPGREELRQSRGWPRRQARGMENRLPVN
jgi:hypothetical protein